MKVYAKLNEWTGNTYEVTISYSWDADEVEVRDGFLKNWVEAKKRLHILEEELVRVAREQGVFLP